MTTPLQVLFAGAEIPVTLIDGSCATVFVRALPLRHLHHVIAAYEHKHTFVELCTYTKEQATQHPPTRFAEISCPVGYSPVPEGWSDNLHDESIDALFKKAEELNFSRAVTWARGQIAAKKTITPLYEETTAQLSPLVEQIVAPLLGKLANLSGSQPNARAGTTSRGKKS
jgi:hypothetical protein